MTTAIHRTGRHLRLRVPSRATTLHGIGGFYLVMAGLNLGIVIRDPETYRHFADQGLFSFVRHGWSDIVMVTPGLWIALLAAGEIAIGAALLKGGRWTLPGYAAVLAFHLLLILFGWAFLIWSGPVLVLVSFAAAREVLNRGAEVP